ncbi:deoxyribonuclease IV [Patescibacteria group bacterium]
MHFGSHVSIAGGLTAAVKRAVDFEETTFQIFSRNPRGRSKNKFSDKDIKEAAKLREQHGIASFYIHTPYFTNLASPKNNLWHFSIKSVVEDLETADKIGSHNFVMHIGHHMDKGLDWGIARVAEALQKIGEEDKSDSRILLEITAGQGTEIGNTFEEIAEIIKRSKLPTKKIGMVLDTAHAFAAGYDLSNQLVVNKTIAELDKTVGLDRVPLIHANDSLVGLGSHKDRHAHIGQGEIGEAGFMALVNHPQLQDKDFIVETKKEGQKKDIEKLKALSGCGC